MTGRDFAEEVCISWCLNNTSQKIGGPDKIFEIDESKFGKRKYNIGCVIVGQCLAGFAVKQDNFPCPGSFQRHKNTPQYHQRKN